MNTNLPHLIKSSRSNPSLLKDLESQISSLSLSSDYSSLYSLLSTNDSDCIFYVMIILDRRLTHIKSMNANDPSLAINNNVTDYINNFVSFVSSILTHLSSSSNSLLSDICLNKFGDVLARLILFCYPMYLPDIFNIFHSLVSSYSYFGYLMINKFSYFTNCSVDIDVGRRNELRKSTSESLYVIFMLIVSQYKCIKDNNLNILSNQSYPGITKDMNGYVNNSFSTSDSISNNPHSFILNKTLKLNIQSCTSLLSFYKDTQFLISFVLEYSKIFPNNDLSNDVLDFLSEYLDRSFSIESLEIILKYTEDKDISFKVNMIDTINYLTINTQNRCLCLFNKACVSFFFSMFDYSPKSCLSFFEKMCKSGNKSLFEYNDLLFEIVKKVIASKLHDNLKQNDKSVSFISSFSSVFPKSTQLLLLEHSSILPPQIFIILIRNTPNRMNLNFTDPFQNTFKLYLEKSPDSVNYLPYLDYSNIEHLKLVNKILKIHNIYKNIDTSILSNILQLLKGEICDDILINIIGIFKIRNVNTNMIGSEVERIMEGEWGHRKKKLFLSFLRNCHENVKNMVLLFYSYFMNNKRKDDKKMGVISNINENNHILDIGIISMIRKKIGDVPMEVLIVLYSNIEYYNPSEISILINDFCNVFQDEVILYFLEPIHQRIKILYDIENSDDIIPVIKSYMNMIERKIIYNINNEFITGIQEIRNVSHSTIETYTQSLVKIMDFKEGCVIRKINDILKKNEEIKYNVEEVIYRLLIMYNCHEMVDGQNEVITMIIDIVNKNIMKKDGNDGKNTEIVGNQMNIIDPEFEKSLIRSFLNVPGTDNEKIISLIKNIREGTNRSRREIIKSFLLSVKGKRLEEIYGKGNKIGKMMNNNQNITKKSESVDVSTFFEKN